MKKFHVTKKTVLTIAGVTLPLTAAAIRRPRLTGGGGAKSVGAYRPDLPTQHELKEETRV